MTPIPSMPSPIQRLLEFAEANQSMPLTISAFCYESGRAEAIAQILGFTVKGEMLTGYQGLRFSNLRYQHLPDLNSKKIKGITRLFTLADASPLRAAGKAELDWLKLTHSKVATLMSMDVQELLIPLSYY